LLCKRSRRQLLSAEIGQLTELAAFTSSKLCLTDALDGKKIADLPLNTLPDQREKTALELLKVSVDDEGGPYFQHLEDESEIKTFDATCKKLNRYLKERSDI